MGAPAARRRWRAGRAASAAAVRPLSPATPMRPRPSCGACVATRRAGAVRPRGTGGQPASRKGPRRVGFRSSRRPGCWNLGSRIAGSATLAQPGDTAAASVSTPSGSVPPPAVARWPDNTLTARSGRCTKLWHCQDGVVTMLDGSICIACAQHVHSIVCCDHAGRRRVAVRRRAAVGRRARGRR